jgi:excisionase family DNA binding protein
MSTITELPAPATVTVEEAARFLGINPRLAYKAVATGEIPSLRIGRRIVIPRGRLIAMLEGEREATD